MSGILAPSPILTTWTQNGLPNAFGTFYSYAAGTSTPIATYPDSTLTTPNANPATFNAQGQLQVWLDPTKTYKFQWFDATGNQLGSVDNINSLGLGSIASNLIPSITNTYNLGSPSFTWANGYFGTNVYIGGLPISSTYGIGNWPRSTGEITAGVTPTNTFFPWGHAWRYLSAAQISDAIAYTYLVDSTTNLQAGMNAAYATEVDFYIPGGGYLISSTLIMNQVDQTNYRDKGFRVYGNGAGPVFVQPGVTGVGTTVIQGNGNFILWRYQQYLGTITTSGNFYVEYIRFQQLSSSCTNPVVQLDVLGEYSVFEKCEIFQAGTGAGLQCLELTKGIIRHCNILNRDWNTAVLGAARVGAGVNIFAQYNAGLGTIYKVTSRGFKDAFVIGQVIGGGIDLSCIAVTECECSVNYRGITVLSPMSKCLLSHNYFEGTELTCILDQGRYTVVRDNFLQNATWTVGINASGNGGGCVYDGNEIGLSAALSGVTGMTVNGSATVPNTVTNNQFVWGSSGTGLSNVTGLQITGANAMVAFHGNSFNPNAGWSGAANCNAFVDATTSSSGSSGVGALGFGLGMDGTTSFPRMSRGALGLWQNTTALGNSAVAAGVLTLGVASDYTLTFSSGQTITSINPTVCDEGHVYVLHVTNGNCTFTANANIKLAGTTNYTPSAAGATITFRMKVNVAWEVTRTAY